MLAIVALVGVGQALALELDDGAISVSAVGALAGAAMFGSRVALAIAVTTAVVDWSARRPAIHNVLFNIGALTFACLAAAMVSSAGFDGGVGELVTVVAGRPRRSAPTSSSTPGSSPRRSRSRPASRGCVAGRSASSGSRRTTSSTASSAA